MRFEEATADVFARHETFHLRYGWLKKAFNAVDEHGYGVFNSEQATVILGVGKNMVRSIKFWSTATKLMASEPSQTNSRLTDLRPTAIGEAIMGQAGWDPYLEDPATLWLLHWLMFAPLSSLPVWWTVFCEFGALEFTEADAVQHAVSRVEASAFDSPNPSSIEKDVNVLLRSYASTDGRSRASVEDLVDSQFRELGLIRRGTTPKSFRMNVGPKPSLAPAVVVYACLDHVARSGGSQTVTVSRLANDIGGPGQIFKLTEQNLVDVLTEAVRPHHELVLASSNGSPQLTWKGDAAAVATDVINRYYGVKTKKAGLLAGRAALGSVAPQPLVLDLGIEDTPPDDVMERLRYFGQSEKAGTKR